MSLPYREEVTVGELDDLMLHLRLEWAGKHEHSDKEPIGHLYKRAPAGKR